MKHLRPLAALLAATLLNACVSTPSLPPKPATPASSDVRSGDTAPPSTRKKGGYYQDDGPDEKPPADLDRVPDAEPRRETLHKFANNPYSVFGIDYQPARELKPYRARGIASWYGRKFHNRATASGERYDMYAMTAAHPTLPIPSYARVTNLANGRSVVVRINDRGPFHAKRVIDLSYTAAHKLDYIERGSAEVLIESIIPEGVQVLASNVPALKGRKARADAAAVAKAAQAEANDPGVTQAPSAMVVTQLAALETPTLPSQPAPRTVRDIASAQGSFLQLGAFSSLANAEGFRSLIEEDLDWLQGKLALYVENDRYRLLAGPFASADEARQSAQRIASQLKLKPFLVQR